MNKPVKKYWIKTPIFIAGIFLFSHNMFSAMNIKWPSKLLVMPLINVVKSVPASISEKPPVCQYKSKATNNEPGTDQNARVTIMGLATERL